jgi:colicin import membrane protein
MSVDTLEARPVSHDTIPRTTTCPKTEKEEFPYGWRRVVNKLPNGQQTYTDRALTIDDILDPQEDDQMPQRPVHAQCSIDIFDMLQNRYRDNTKIGVYFDCKMIWGIPGLPGPAPDVAVIPDVKDKKANIASFKVKEQGTRPCLVIEVVSPTYPGDNTDKVQIYEQAGVEEYIIVDPHSERVTPFYKIEGYRLNNGKYQPIKPDRLGRLRSQTTEVLFGVYQEGERLRLNDATTGEWLLNATEEAKAREEEAKARIEAEARAQQEANRALTEVKARIDAEIRAKEETKARIDAEIQTQIETKARIEAEARAQSEAQVRAQLEKRLKELEATLSN